MADPDYMTRQAELTWSMRTILMEWLIEVHSKFRLLPETLLIAVNLVDRFLTLRVVSLAKLQLVGLTAMFIAAKYEEVICPSIQHFIHMTDESFEMEEMLRAERYMLSTLQFDLSYPNPLHFLRRISKADDYDMQTRTVAKFLIEIVLVEQRLIGVESSRLAAAAIWLARLGLERCEWVCLFIVTSKGVGTPGPTSKLTSRRPTWCTTRPTRRPKSLAPRRSCSTTSWIPSSTLTLLSTERSVITSSSCRVARRL